MVTALWSFSGYTFPWECQPTRGGAGDWNKKRKDVIQEPINSNIDVVINFGFASGRRTIKGRCSLAFRTQMMSFFSAQTVGNLVDAESRSVSCMILEADFQTVLPTQRYEYTITFIAR